MVSDFPNSPKDYDFQVIEDQLPNIIDIKYEFSNAFRLSTHEIIQSGSFMYRPGDYMGWHTNHKRPGVRIYLVWSEDGKSEFNYSFGDEVNTIREKKGWNINIFRVDFPPSHIWHSVNSKSGYRISIGFRINDKNDWECSRV